ncbi:MAG: TetR/AcrR family transcriptional regulator, partial [Nocardioidaceae bacterium]
MTVQVETALLPPVPELTDARRRLYEAAIVLFGDRGFHGVSVRDLAAALGQQPGALYAHVASKQDLLFALVSIGVRAHRDTLKAALLDAGREPADQVLALTTAHVALHLRDSALARVTNRESRALSDDQRDAVLAVRRESEQLFYDVIERGERLGAFHVADPVLAVAGIAAMGVRAADWWTPDGPHTLEQIADTYAGYALR